MTMTYRSEVKARLIAHAAVTRAEGRLTHPGGRALGAIRPVLTQVLAEELEIVLAMDEQELATLYRDFLEADEAEAKHRIA